MKAGCELICSSNDDHCKGERTECYSKTALQVKNSGDCDKKVKFTASGLSIMKLWIVLIITVAFCALLLTGAHISHSLTLRVEAYHSLYNLLSLVGCLLTVKLCSEGNSLKNTFGWARVELLSTLCTLVFLGSLCFGVAVDSIQTAAHAGHQDPMHHPIPIIALGGIGLLVNTVVFFLVGGYTHHQGCHLERKNSIVWIKQSPLNTSSKSNGLIANHDTSKLKSCQGIRGTLRDISGLIMVMICATIVLWDEGQTLALYVDPACAVLSAAFLLFLSYPYGKECSHILLQTIPGHIDVQSFSGRLLQKFPEIVNVHHLHIWSLTPGKVVATAHVVFNTPGIYKRLSEELLDFFAEEEISKVTLQPEFVSLMENISDSKESSCQCLLQCSSSDCENENCCQGCTEVTSIIRNKSIGYEPQFRAAENSHANPMTYVKPSVEESMHCAALNNTRVKQILANFELKKNNLTGNKNSENINRRTPANKLQHKNKNLTFHSLQDLRISSQNTNSGRFGEYLAAFEELRMKDRTNSFEQL